MTSNTKKRKKEKIHKDGKIAIIGSGPGALSTALALQQDGFQHVVVYERDEHFHSRKDGYGLTLTYNPSKTSPLTQLGLLEKLARLDCPSRAHYVFDSEGNVLGYFGNRFSKSSRGYGQRGNLRVPRQVLRQVMMNTLKERDVHNNRIRIEWNKKLIGFSTSENAPFQTTLKFEDGTSATADLLVGADGVHSTVMKQILSENEQCTAYLGVMIVLGITQDFYHPLLDERGFYTLDGNHRLFTMPYEGSRMTDLMENGIALNDQSTNINRTRRYMWQLSYNLPYEEAVKISKEGAQSLLREVLRRTKHWHDPVQTMIQSTPLDTIWGTPLMDRSPSEILVKMNEVYKSSKQKKHMRAIALGDAMHAMSPFKGWSQE
jgi:salicylate hydroxylase